MKTQIQQIRAVAAARAAAQLAAGRKPRAKSWSKFPSHVQDRKRKRWLAD